MKKKVKTKANAHAKVQGKQKSRERKKGEEERPLLYVDVNLGPNRTERIIVRKGDTAEKLANEFSR